MNLNLLISISYGWGYSAHFAIGNLTMMLLTPPLREKVTNLLLNDTSDTSLGGSYEGSLGRASTWADYIKSFKEFQWSKSIHYIDTHDNPPDVCSYAVTDCGDGPYGCIVRAIHHFHDSLGRNIPVTNTGPATALTAVQGLKFFVHLVQDLHQPLHVCGKERGGNQRKVKFGRKTSNLHSVWDSLMVNKRIQDDFNNRRQDWIDSLLFKAPKLSQICVEDCQLVSCADNPVECVKNWSTWINALNCKRIWKFDELASEVRGQTNFNIDLSGSYYKKNIGLMEDLIIAAAARSAALITQKLK
eukprot:NODE_329_length_10886_cov_0.296653.p4 type:complete len:301 gc:universal NODE_329_length_10886_cov_0.296653:3425-4327(+)